MADLLVSVRVGIMIRVKVRIRLTVRAYVSDVIGRRFEKVRNGHRFKNWTPI
jgi:hypothetical protein